MVADSCPMAATTCVILGLLVPFYLQKTQIGSYKILAIVILTPIIQLGIAYSIQIARKKYLTVNESLALSLMETS